MHKSFEQKVRVGIMGASGYMGGEALRILLHHPAAELAWLSSREPGPLEVHHPNLYGLGLSSIHPDAITPCDVVFLALPTDSAIQYAHTLRQQGTRIIDLGAGFRLRDRATWELVYGMTHPHWQLAEQAVYGLSELHEKRVSTASIVANPGCYSSAAILALAPLVKEQLIHMDHIVVHGLSGTAGAGADPGLATHHPEISNNLLAYNVVDHRHSYEMEQELSLLAHDEVTVHFTPIYVPIVRGIMNTCYSFARQPLKRQDLLEIYQSFYANHPFVRIYDRPRTKDASWQYTPYPPVSAVAGTNYCFIGLDIDEKRNRIVVFSVLDSLGKGGAQAGIENMNLMYGFPRETGLQRRGLHPG